MRKRDDSDEFSTVSFMGTSPDFRCKLAKWKFELVPVRAYYAIALLGSLRCELLVYVVPEEDGGMEVEGLLLGKNSIIHNQLAAVYLPSTGEPVLTNTALGEVLVPFARDRYCAGGICRTRPLLRD
jgi:hypothetical protein